MLMPAINIRQPWAFMIVQGCEPSVRKDIENRTWPLPAKYVGLPMLVVASGMPFFRLRDAKAEYDARGMGARPLLDAVLAAPEVIDVTRNGGMVGVVRFAASIRNEGQTPPSPWGDPESPWWWPIVAARQLPFVRCKGQLSVFWRDCPGAERHMEGF